MAESLVSLNEVFKRGLRPDKDLRRDLRFASSFRGMYVSPGGAYPHRPIKPAFTEAQLASLGIGTSAMPLFPQLLASRGLYLLANDQNLYVVPSPIGSAVPTIISASDPYILVQGGLTAKATVAGGGQWDYVNISGKSQTTQDPTTPFEIINNANNMIVTIQRRNTANRYRAVFTQADTRIPCSTIFHKGRFVSCGFQGANYWSANMQGLFADWIEEGIQWNYSLTAAGPEKNWVFYSTIGVFDLIYHWLYEYARYGSLDITLDWGAQPADRLFWYEIIPDNSFTGDPTSETDDIIAGRVKLHYLKTDPLLFEFGTGGFFSKDWSHNPQNRYIEFENATAASDNILYLDWTKTSRPLFVGSYYRIRFSYKIKHSATTATNVMTVTLGGTSVITIKGTGGAEVDGVVDLVVQHGSVGGPYGETLTFTANQNYTSSDYFRMYGLSIREELKNPHGYNDRDADVGQAFLLELFRQNSCGFIPMPFSGLAMRLCATKDFILVFGEDGIAALRPEAQIGMGLSFMELNEQISQTGLKERGAVIGDVNEIFFVDTSGVLWRVRNNLETTRLGFAEFLATLYNISMSFDSNRRFVYISGLKWQGTAVAYTYVFDGFGLTEIRQQVSSLVLDRGILTGMVSDIGNIQELLIETNYSDYGYRGLKELNDLEIEYRQISNIRATTLGRPDAAAKPISIGPVYGDGNGRFFPLLAAEELAFRITGDVLTSVVSNGGFASSTGWTIGAAWAIASGVATHTGSNAALLSQASTALAVQLQEGNEYLVQYEVTAYTDGAVRVILGSTEGLARSAAGVYQETIIAGSGTTVDFKAVGAGNLFNGSIDNVKVWLIEAKLNRVDVRLDYADNRSAFSGRQRLPEA